MMMPTRSLMDVIHVDMHTLLHDDALIHLIHLTIHTLVQTYLPFFRPTTPSSDLTPLVPAP